MPQKPANYGDWWRTHAHGADWYSEIFDARKTIHNAFVGWVKTTEAVEGQPFASVLEVGCGCAVVYPDIFLGRRYTGFDFSQKEIDWCRANRGQAGREFLCGDFIVAAERPPERYDLVFSHAVIDHVYNCDAFLAALVGASKGWVYLTSYRGWFPNLWEHVYAWDEWTTAYYNSLAPDKLHAQLKLLGCTDIRVEPIATGKPEIPQETLIIARAPGARSTPAP